jgi:hypothetical protein
MRGGGVLHRADTLCCYLIALSGLEMERGVVSLERGLERLMY